MEINDLLEKYVAIFAENPELRKLNNFERVILMLKCEELKILGKISKSLDVMAFRDKFVKEANNGN